METITTQVEREVEEVSQEKRWFLSRKTTRRVRRLVEQKVTVLVNGLGDRVPGPEMVQIPAGSFTMGSPDGEAGRADTELQRQVRISRPFRLSATPVTQQLWEAVVGTNPSNAPGIFRPVHGITWFDAVRFCNALSALFGLQPAYTFEDSMLGTHVNWAGLEATGFRLPTDAEWEYACRAGDASPRHGGLEEIAWHAGNSGGVPCPAGRKAPNAWGLYDMLGNVENWVWDRAPGSSDSSGHWLAVGGEDNPEILDPLGPRRGTARISRGDGYTSSASEQVSGRQIERFRAAARRIRPPTAKDVCLGLRVARSVVD